VDSIPEVLDVAFEAAPRLPSSRLVSQAL
jgi:hypothetical protein